jgi:hypothetical protein
MYSEMSFKGGFCMASLYKFLRSLIILLLICSLVFFSFYIIIAAVVAAGLVGLYRYYFTKRKTKIFETKSKGYTAGKGFTSGEVIDLPK